MKAHDVCLSRPGVICGAGHDAESLWHACVSGDQSGIKRVKAFSGKEFFAGRIDDGLLPETGARYDMRLIRIEEAALRQIDGEIQDAVHTYGKDRVAVCVGSCDNGTQLSFAGHREYLEKGSFPQGYSLEMQGADYPATYIAEKYGITGPCLAFSTACSSSAGAIIKAAELIRSGIADAVVAGGADIASDTVLIGFDSLEAVSSGITNPFSVNRHGITLGEGAAFFVVSKDAPDGGQEAVRLLGGGESADAYHMTSPDPEGTGAAAAMRNALRDACLEPGDIDYVNLHGTGTKFNDAMEAKAVDAVFAGCSVPVSSTKPLTGHTLGAAGALEAAICYTALVKNRNAAGSAVSLPVQAWDGAQDPDIPVINILTKGRSAQTTGRVRICMSNSFAFGGSNASLILGVYYVRT